MTVLVSFAPRVQSYGSIVPVWDNIAQERCLTFCRLDAFMTSAGPLARRLVEEASRRGALDDLHATAKSVDGTLLVTFLAYELQPGEFPGEHREWHVDRVGPGNSAYGRGDYSPNSDCPSLVLWSGSPAVDSSHTEILDWEMSARLPRLVDLTPQELSEILAVAAEGGPVSHVSNCELVQLSGLSVHRPAVATGKYWRALFRVAVGRLPYSQFENHSVNWITVTHARTGETRRRVVAGSAGIMAPRSAPIEIS